MHKDTNKFNSRAWHYFMEVFFNRSPYMMWHDGADTSCLLRLNKEELKHAEELLIESVKQDGMWPTEGLIFIKSRKAIPVLKQKLEQAEGVIRIRIAYALEKIENYGQYIPILIHELKKNKSQYDRLEAAMKLREFPTSEVIEALYEGMMDEEYLVRNHSAESLLKIHGLVPHITEYDEIYRYIRSESQKLKNTKKAYALAVKIMQEICKDKNPGK